MAYVNLLTITFLLILLTFFNTGNNIKPPSTILIFGDSTVDTGNNNYIKTLAKGNYPPYGRDFPGHIPTGRFSNGKLVPDFIASTLGIKETVPPFLHPNLSDDELLSGVSFASGGSGLDDLTTVASKAIPVSRQMKLFREYIRRIKGIVGEEKAKKIISDDSLVVLSAGPNDFIFNFYDVPTRRSEFTLSGYQDFLLDRLQSFVKELYELGCRRMIVVGLPPMGCLPIQMTLKFKNPLNRNCLEDQNSDALLYNHKLSKLLDQLQASLSCSNIAFADIYQPFIDIIDHPRKYGFMETKRGCCGTGLIEAAFLCNPTTPTCRKPSQFLFWDSIHPTQSAYQLLFEYLQTEILQKLPFAKSC